MKNIRSAVPADSDQIAEIYRPYVLETAISFEIEPPSKIEMQDRILQTSEYFPWLVWDQDGLILGYAYACSFKSRVAYSWSVESTVYVRRDAQERGIGKKLYSSLLEELKLQGVVNAIGGIALPNDASVRLHESLGFKQVAQFKNIGFKHGKWWDVGYWQLQLQKTAEPTSLKKPSC